MMKHAPERTWAGGVVLVLFCAAAGPAGCIFDTSGAPYSNPDGQVPPDVQPQFCGNGEMEDGESCDGSDLGGLDCVSRGFVGGALGCTPECELDETQCEIGGDCGNGVLDGIEECDGAELGGATCSSEASQPHGDLACTGQCTLDTSDCHNCGDGVVEGPEGCDGSLNGRDCVAQGHDGGQLVCTAACQFDDAGCYDCGDGVCDTTLGETRQNCPADCGWVSVAAGAFHTCAVSGDGSVWCWGENGAGQLGDSTTDDRHEPTLVPGLAGALAVTAGIAHSCAVLDDGSVWCWGSDNHGQLGNGAPGASLVPVQVVNLINVVAIDAGGEHTCALSGQNLWCWGRDERGQLGDDLAGDQQHPVPVSSSTGLNLVLAVSAGEKHTCAIRADNTAWCWGDKGSGRLGDGTNTDQHQPVPVNTTTGLTAVSVISAGFHHSCAIDTGGAVWCWGDKADGRLGDGTDTARPIPQPVDLTSGLTAATDVFAAKTHSCALDSAGAAWCWGGNGDGQLGDGTTGERVVPEPVDITTGLTAASMITAGDLHSCALKTDRTVWCWGANGVGQLGDQTTNAHLSPAAIFGD